MTKGEFDELAVSGFAVCSPSCYLAVCSIPTIVRLEGRATHNPKQPGGHGLSRRFHQGFQQRLQRRQRHGRPPIPVGRGTEITAARLRGS